MSVHPLWRPFEQPTDEEVAAARLLPHTPETVEVSAPDPGWTDAFASLREVILDALGDRALAVTHVGSTSVPGLWAKPVIDVDLTVADPADEASYVVDLEAVGMVLRVREPDWEQHRLLRSTTPYGNVHVWGPQGAEAARHLLFRDWLATHDDDRDAYGALKSDLAGRGFTDSMHYNNAKAGFVYDLYEKIFAADPDHPHDPHPR